MPSHVKSPISKILHSAKTHKGRRVLASREPQFHEGNKQTLFLKGNNTCTLVTQILNDLYNLKKLSSTKLQRKNPIYPFQDSSLVEKLCVRAECGIFVMANHSKKRPNNLTIGRIFDEKLLDMVELGVESYRSISEFGKELIPATSHPIVVFLGPQFGAELSGIKNLLLDTFRGVKTEKIPPHTLEHVFLFSTNDVTSIYMRVYRVAREGRNVSGIVEMGPRVRFTIRRQMSADEKVFRKSLRQASVGQIRHAKNVSYNPHGSKLGRVHMNRQEFSRLQTRKRKALKTEGKKRQRVE